MFLWVGSWEIRCFLVLGGDAEGFAELLFYVYFSFESRYRVRYFFYPTTLTWAFLEEEIEWVKELERFLKRNIIICLLILTFIFFTVF